ncbi:MAG: RNA polymerase sigma factor [Oligoflexia bacterium]|nr:RNA polymerase sigma factor [Oligoflexia bacterium]
MDEDIELMLELKAGNRNAFDKLIKKFGKRMINYAWRFTGSREDAEDIAQEVFIRVYNAAPAYYPSAKFTTWLYRIASNVSVDWLRKNRDSRKTASIDDPEAGAEKHAAAGENTGDALEEKEKNEEVREALLSLPENQRAAVILKIYEDRPYSEIASIIGVSVASVESLLFRARQAIRNRLKKIS